MQTFINSTFYIQFIFIESTSLVSTELIHELVLMKSGEVNSLAFNTIAVTLLFSYFSITLHKTAATPGPDI
jgi:hypothetical protein